MSVAHPIIPDKARKSGCRRLLPAIVITALGLSFAVYYSHMAAQSRLLDTQGLSHLGRAITAYKLDCHRFPIAADSPTDRDLSLRSRGPMLSALLGNNIGGLNPKQIQFIDMPIAINRQSGLWQDGDEWVLSDRWGEPFHIILDTNGDGVIANPAFTPDPSGPKDAEKSTRSPPPQTLPATVLIYSSGADRDPKTWHDNIGSWNYP